MSRPRTCPKLVAALRDAEVLGANVTVPHKAAVMALLDEIELGAHAAGAVNTIVNRDGRLDRLEHGRARDRGRDPAG